MSLHSFHSSSQGASSSSNNNKHSILGLEFCKIRTGRSGWVRRFDGVKGEEKGIRRYTFLTIEFCFVLLRIFSRKASHDISEKLIWWVHGTYWKYIIYVSIEKILGVEDWDRDKTCYIGQQNEPNPSPEPAVPNERIKTNESFARDSAKIAPNSLMFWDNLQAFEWSHNCSRFNLPFWYVTKF